MARNPKVTVHAAEAGQQALPASQAPPETPGLITDKRGRRIKVKKLNALARVDFADIVGASRIANGNVAGPAGIAFSVIEIDGDPVFQPNSWNELRALISRLDDDGIEAAAEAHVAAGWVEKMPETNDEGES